MDFFTRPYCEQNTTKQHSSSTFQCIENVTGSICDLRVSDPIMITDCKIIYFYKQLPQDIDGNNWRDFLNEKF